MATEYDISVAFLPYEIVSDVHCKCGASALRSRIYCAQVVRASGDLLSKKAELSATPLKGKPAGLLSNENKQCEAFYFFIRTAFRGSADH
jgi:hypothetical protein